MEEEMKLAAQWQQLTNPTELRVLFGTCRRSEANREAWTEEKRKQMEEV